MQYKRITMKDLAKMADVSVATVSLVLNEKSGVSKQKRKEILTLAKKYNYVVNKNARILKTNENRKIGVITPDIQNPFYSWIVSELNLNIEARGYTMLLSLSGDEIETKQMNEIRSEGVDGIILIPSFRQMDSNYIHEPYQLDIPLVVCTVNLVGTNYPYVTTDFKMGEYLLAKHLIESGITRFAFVGMSKVNWITGERLSGLLQAMDEFNLEPKNFKFYEICEPNYESGYEITSKIIKFRPEVILCINDVLAIGVLKYLQDSGFEVPNDISVAGYDDIWISHIISPNITTVRQPVEKIAIKTIELLFEKINGNKNIENAVVIKPELIIRNSTR